MMNNLARSHKITPTHLERKAVVYLRQSSERQVRENQESQRLQYAVADRARRLGWKTVEVIDADLGSSAGVGAAKREGFERLIASVAMGEVGIVMSREASRLSRTDKDWCRLLEVCGIFGTLTAFARKWRTTSSKRKGVIRRSKSGTSTEGMGQMVLSEGDSWVTNHSCHYVPVCPNPPAPRTVGGSSATSLHSTRGTGRTSICAMRIPRVTRNGSFPRLTRSTLPDVTT